MKNTITPISISWTTDERLYNIARIARELQAEAKSDGLQRVHEFAQRMELIADMPQSFLTANEEMLLGTEELDNNENSGS